jgi:hypothetical protein
MRMQDYKRMAGTFSKRKNWASIQRIQRAHSENLTGNTNEDSEWIAGADVTRL